LEIAFWILLFIVFYTYVGYAFLLALLLTVKKLSAPAKTDPRPADGNLPRVCLFTTAYNESAYVAEKVRNLQEINYPNDHIQYLWITDGSNDPTPEILLRYPRMEVQHLPERRGKIHAMNRGMQFVDAPIVIFSDSNTMLCKDAVKTIVGAFNDPGTGCVAGEKRIADLQTDDAAGSGENLYWKFESWVKRMDSELNSCVGAAGELFAIRTELFEPVENDTILDDFIISLRIALKGYRIAYTPEAYAIETASESVPEELKRKIRIAAGGLQALSRLKSLLNPFRHGLLTFQYVSHKVLRWTIAPMALFGLFPVNLVLFLNEAPTGHPGFYSFFFLLQALFYLLAIPGWLFERKKLRFKVLFIPYYFVAINYASLLGWARFLRGKQTVNWEKSKRA
jgi:cellulose synthase/poly-beta-1,6-N-acetylglucosamine synthase-like glycosyltransferase